MNNYEFLTSILDGESLITPMDLVNKLAEHGEEYEAIANMLELLYGSDLRPVSFDHVLNELYQSMQDQYALEKGLANKH